MNALGSFFQQEAFNLEKSVEPESYTITDYFIRLLSQFFYYIAACLRGKDDFLISEIFLGRNLVELKDFEGIKDPRLCFVADLLENRKALKNRISCLSRPFCSISSRGKMPSSLFVKTFEGQKKWDLVSLNFIEEKIESEIKLTKEGVLVSRPEDADIDQKINSLLEIAVEVFKAFKEVQEGQSRYLRYGVRSDMSGEIKVCFVHAIFS